MTRVMRDERPSFPVRAGVYDPFTLGAEPVAPPVESPSLYALGFAAGERAAFRERKSNKPTERATYGIADWDRGWIEGYTPRNPAWLAGRAA